MTNSLQGLTVLVTRPKPAGEKLCELIQAEGGHTIFFPTIEIEPPLDLAVLTQRFSQLDQQDWLIFLSPQAVTQFRDRYVSSLPAEIKVAAVGTGTLEALKAAGIAVNASPAEDWSSEGLLGLPEFQSVAGKKIALIKGEGGRELLQDVLNERGASITNIIVYRRVLPKVDATSALKSLRQYKINAIVCASGEAVQNLKKLLSQDEWQALQNQPLIVISQRIAEIAKSLEFNHVIVAKNASQVAIVESLKGLTIMSVENETKTTSPRSGVSYDAIETFIIAVVALVLVAAIGYVSLNLKSVNGHLSKRIAILESRTGHAASETNTLKDLADQIQQLRGELASQQQAINQFSTIQHNNQDLLVISEAQYLVHLAENNLQLANNIPLAIKLLQGADMELSPLTDARASQVRKAISEDIAALQMIAKVDLSDIFNRIVGLNAQIDKLPLLSAQISGQQTVTDIGNDNAELPWWKRGMRQSWADLQKIIVVQHSPINVPPIVTPDQQGIIFLNLHSLLQDAQWALLHKNAEIYNASLQQIVATINQYFVQDAAETKAALGVLNELQQVNVHPDVPKQLSSIQAFKEYFNQA